MDEKRLRAEIIAIVEDSIARGRAIAVREVVRTVLERHPPGEGAWTVKKAHQLVQKTVQRRYGIPPGIAPAEAAAHAAQMRGYAKRRRQRGEI